MRGRLGRPATGAAVLLLAAGATAGAQDGGAPRVDHYVELDGTGLLIANPGGHPVSWERCAGDACVPFDDGDGDANFLHVRDEPVGSVFRATQLGTTVSSQPWQGRVGATAPPSVTGEARVGARVAPVAATWAGGWGREADWLQLQACKDAAGTTCVTIYDPIKFGRCGPEPGRTIPARYAGFYLRVADARIDRDQPFTQEGYDAPEGVAPHQPGAATALLTVGLVADGPAPPTECGSPPRFPDPTPPERPTATLPDRLTPSGPAARVSCPAACTAVLEVRHAGRSLLSVERRLPKGTSALRLPHHRAARAFRTTGRVKLALRVDGQLVAAHAATV